MILAIPRRTGGCLDRCLIQLICSDPPLDQDNWEPSFVGNPEECWSSSARRTCKRGQIRNPGSVGHPFSETTDDAHDDSTTSISFANGPFGPYQPASGHESFANDAWKCSAGTRILKLDKRRQWSARADRRYRADPSRFCYSSVERIRQVKFAPNPSIASMRWMPGGALNISRLGIPVLRNGLRSTEHPHGMSARFHYCFSV